MTKKLLDPKKRHLTPSDFESMSAFKMHTSKVFLDKFREFIDAVSNFEGKGLLDGSDKRTLMDMVKSALNTRGQGVGAWMGLQSFRQCFSGEGTSTHLDQVSIVSAAYYAKFASYEIHDDLPILDNDKVRRGAPSVWSKYGESNALLFANMLSTFSNYLIHDPILGRGISQRLSRELALTDVRVLIGQTIHLTEEELKSPYALDITLKCHALKAASFTSNVAGAGAVIAGADEGEIVKMREFARALSHCLQIENDSHPKEIKKDLLRDSPNVLSAAFGGDIEEGAVKTKELLSIYELKAREILNSFNQPNEKLVIFLNAVVERFQRKISFTVSYEKSDESMETIDIVQGLLYDGNHK